MYLLVGKPDPTISTRRTEDELRDILNGMNDIWSKADIHLNLRNVATVEVPGDVNLVRTAMGRARLDATVTRSTNTI